MDNVVFTGLSEKKKLADVTVIVIGNACRQVAEMFGAIKIETLENIEMDELVQAIVFTQEKNCIIAHHDRPYTDNIIKWLDKRFLSFVDYYKYAVYGLPQTSEPVPPCKFEPFMNLEQIPKYKSVILSPYAKSVVELPSDFWKYFVDKYTESGYKVYTNTVGEEKALKGTFPLEIPISQMHSAVEYAGTFISIRNGLCDVVNSANCRKIVVFPDCFYSTTPHKVEDFFALPDYEKITYR